MKLWLIYMYTRNIHCTYSICVTRVLVGLVHTGVQYVSSMLNMPFVVFFCFTVATDVRHLLQDLLHPLSQGVLVPHVGGARQVRARALYVLWSWRLHVVHLAQEAQAEVPSWSCKTRVEQWRYQTGSESETESWFEILSSTYFRNEANSKFKMAME